MENKEKEPQSRDSFVMYRSFWEAVKLLPSSQRDQAVFAMMEYAFDKNEDVDLESVPKAIFTLMKPQLDANHKKFLNGCKPKKKQVKSKIEAKQKQNISKAEGNANVNDNVNENVNALMYNDEKPKKEKMNIGDIYDKSGILNLKKNCLAILAVEHLTDWEKTFVNEFYEALSKFKGGTQITTEKAKKFDEIHKKYERDIK